MQSREEVIEAAMLARMVGSHLSGVDQLTVERSNNSANKINMQNFVAPLVGKPIQQTSFEAEVPLEVRKAYEGVNELALQSIPEPINAHAPLVGTPLPIVPPVIPNSVPANQVQPKASKEEKILTSLITRSDVDSIRNSLKSIDKSLAGMLKLLQNSKLTKHE
ncbi:MAG: hypothetical protein EBU90_00715 [Proteobacteria bacterium]|nr:hypothetical protein [Pseudomonadota bacterium]NBP12954.1 hypothetical protein [bacterium]